MRPMLAHFQSLTPAEQLLLAAYLLVVSLLALFGINRYVLLLGARRASGTGAAPPALPPELPRVTVQVPLFNERYVAERLLRAVAALDWPPDRLEIQALDDSLDETLDIVAAEVARLRARGVNIVHLRRPDRRGFKAGALAAGLERATGSLIAIFDADFQPTAGFLRATVPFFADPTVGLVQTRWGHLNRGHSLLTRVQALMLDGHFEVEQAARASRGLFFNFNGTAGIWRRSAIEAAGGWQSDTLTEDLDLSYRAQLAGWRFVYRNEIEAPAELPVDLDSLKSQQHRWAKGSAQAAVKLLPRIWRVPLPLRTRIQATFHLTGNFAYLLLLLLALLVHPALELRYRQGWTQTLVLDLPLFLLATLSVAAFYSVPLARERSGAGRWLLLPALMALGIGMSVNNSRAVLSGLAGHGGEFRRTPKFGGEGRDPGWKRKHYRAGRSLWLALEITLSLWFGWLFAHALSQRLWASLPFLALFACGFAWTALGSLSVPKPASGSALAAPHTSPGTSS